MRSLRNLSLKTQIVVAVCFVNLAVIVLVSYGNYHWYSTQLTDQTMEQTQQVIEQAGSNINTYINELYRLTLTPYYNDELLHVLGQTASSAQQQLEFNRVVEGFLSSVMSLPRSEILRVYIMNDNALYSYTRTPYEMAEYSSYLESDWYKQACATTDPLLLPPRLERVYGDNLTPIFSVVRQLRSKEDNNITLGVVKVAAASATRWTSTPAARCSSSTSKTRSCILPARCSRKWMRRMFRKSWHIPRTIFSLQTREITS